MWILVHSYLYNYYHLWPDDSEKNVKIFFLCINYLFRKEKGCFCCLLQDGYIWLRIIHLILRTVICNFVLLKFSFVCFFNWISNLTQQSHWSEVSTRYFLWCMLTSILTLVVIDTKFKPLLPCGSLLQMSVCNFLMFSNKILYSIH